MVPLSKENRREVCVHEAAHAVVAHQCGIGVYGLAVAPEGSIEWACEGRKGTVLTDLWGVCHTSDSGNLRYLKWDEDEWYYRLKDGSNRNALLADLSTESRKFVQRLIRADICCFLAGPAASQIWRATWSVFGKDIPSLRMTSPERKDCRVCCRGGMNTSI